MEKTCCRSAHGSPGGRTPQSGCGLGGAEDRPEHDAGPPQGEQDSRNPRCLPVSHAAPAPAESRGEPGGWPWDSQLRPSCHEHPTFFPPPTTGG